MPKPFDRRQAARFASIAKRRLASNRGLIVNGWCPAKCVTPARKTMEPIRSEGGAVLVYRCACCSRRWAPDGHRAGGPSVNTSTTLGGLQ